MNKKTIKKNIVKLFFPALLHTKAHLLFKFAYSGVGSILMFHRVYPEVAGPRLQGNSGLEVTPEYLEKLIIYFSSKGYEFLSLDDVYNDIKSAYERIFKRIGVKFLIVDADAGVIGDSSSKSHEFQVLASSGEDEIVFSDDDGYASNIEKSKTVRSLLGANDQDLVLEKVEAFFDTYMFKSAIRAMIFGILLTISVQSSSITTSTVIPLAGAGVLSLRQIYPFTLGANIGTTVTALLASLTLNITAMVAAFAHLFFNIFGILLIYANPFLRDIPLKLSEIFSDLAQKSKFIPIIYLLVVFFIIPFLIILLGR